MEELCKGIGNNIKRVSRRVVIIYQQYDTLTWSSHAKDGDKKILITHWELINKTVKYIFGSQTKIVNMFKNH